MSFIVSKLFWVFLAPGNILILLLLLGAFLAQSRSWPDFGRRLQFDIALLLFFVAIFPVGDWMLTPLENRFPPARPDHVDGIILLGGGEKPHISEMRGQPTVSYSAPRYILFAALARQYPQARLIFSGGSGMLQPDAKMKDAEVAKAALVSLGVPEGRMTFEDQSRNTHENAVQTAAIAHPGPQQKWLLVTSAWHMPRAMACFRKAGFNVYPAPAGYLTDGQLSSKLQFDLAEHLADMTIAVHEYYGLAAYRLMGYTDALWPR